MGIEIYQRIAVFGKKLAQFDNIDDTLPAIAEEAKAIINTERCSIFIADHNSNMLWTKLSDGIGRIRGHCHFSHRFHHPFRDLFQLSAKPAVEIHAPGPA